MTSKIFFILLCSYGNITEVTMTESSSQHDTDSVFVKLKDEDSFVQAAGLQRTKYSGRKSSVERMLEETFATSEKMSLHSPSNGSPHRSSSPSRGHIPTDSLSSDEYISAAGLNKTGSIGQRKSSRERLLEESLGTIEDSPQSPHSTSLQSPSNNSQSLQRSHSPVRDNVREDLLNDDFAADAGLRKSGSVSGRKSSREKLLEESLGTSEVQPQSPRLTPHNTLNMQRSHSPKRDNIVESLSSNEFIADAGLKKSGSVASRKSSRERLLEESLKTSNSLPSSPRLAQSPRLSSSSKLSNSSPRLSTSDIPQRSNSPSAERLREGLTTDEFLVDAGLKTTGKMLSEEIALEKKREEEIRQRDQEILDKADAQNNLPNPIEGESHSLKHSTTPAEQNDESFPPPPQLESKEEQDPPIKQADLTTKNANEKNRRENQNEEETRKTDQEILDKADAQNNLPDPIEGDTPAEQNDESFPPPPQFESKEEQNPPIKQADLTTENANEKNRLENYNAEGDNNNIEPVKYRTKETNNNESDTAKRPNRSSVYQLKHIDAPAISKGSRIAARTQHLFQQYEKDYSAPDIKPTINIQEDIGENRIGIQDRKISYARATTDVRGVENARLAKDEELNEIRRLHQQHVKDLEVETLSRK